ncbi:MAG: hypothetical protein WDL99_08960 [Candidatus Omnitrophota bacterium]|jgi:hypothetical protein
MQKITVMNKKIKILIFQFSFIFILMFSAFGQETVTITTYYPAPYGVYNQFVTQTLGVGDNNNDGSLNGSDAPDPSNAAQAGNVWIKGRVGINTTTPHARLEVNKTVAFRPQATAPSCIEGAVYYDQAAKAFKYCNGSSWKGITSTLGSTEYVTAMRALSYGGTCAGGSLNNNPVNCPAGYVVTGIRIITSGGQCPLSCSFYSFALQSYALICRKLE